MYYINGKHLFMKKQNSQYLIGPQLDIHVDVIPL